MEPVTTLTAVGIATLVFTKAIEKTVETLTESTLNKLNHLRDKIGSNAILLDEPKKVRSPSQLLSTKKYL
ncbi:MAG: hypothetical protein KME31_38055 [Tolypothrix carrinoi HA7290-LM1]|jgi:hypothetical protein|nr:hypothetical protein [Tolypothrix carrinoi HA7290-LM1]